MSESERGSRERWRLRKGGREREEKSERERVERWRRGVDCFSSPQIPDSDLVKRRIGQMVDPMSGAVFIRRVYSPDQQQQAKNKEGRRRPG